MYSSVLADRAVGHTSCLKYLLVQRGYLSEYCHIHCCLSDMIETTASNVTQQEVISLYDV